MRRPLASSSFFLGSLLLTRAALACSFGPPTPLVVDAHEQDVDHTPPGKIPSAGVTVERGHGPTGGGCNGGAASTSCDDIGTVTLFPTAPTDDRTPPADLGYVVNVVAGALPKDATLPDGPVLLDPDGGLRIRWIDGANDDQESIDLSVTLTAVDRGGNPGAASEPIRVHDAGRSSGCRAARGGDGSSFAIVLGLLATARLAARRGPPRARLRH